MYSKLFSSLVHSSLWSEPDHIRLLFITLLAIADRDGIVYGSRSGLMRAAMIDLDAADEIDPWVRLMGPDNDSSDLMRNPENEGRRIEEIPGGFRIINYTYYKSLRDSEDRKVQNREAQKRHREKVSPDKPVSAIVSHRKPIESKIETEKKKEGHPPVLILSHTRLHKKFLEWMAYRKSIGRKPKDWEAFFGKQAEWLLTFSETDQIEILDQSIRNGWMGLFEPKKLNGQKKPTKPDYKRNYLPAPNNISDEELAAKRAQVRELSAKLRDELKK